MSDGIAWARMAPELSRPMEPAAKRPLGDRQRGADARDFADLVDRPDGGARPAGAPSEAEDSKEVENGTETTSEEAASRADEDEVRSGGAASVPPSAEAGLPPALPAGEAVEGAVPAGPWIGSAMAGAEPWEADLSLANVPEDEARRAPETARAPSVLPSPGEAADGFAQAARSIPPSGIPGEGDGTDQAEGAAAPRHPELSAGAMRHHGPSLAGPPRDGAGAAFPGSSAQARIDGPGVVAGGAEARVAVAALTPTWPELGRTLLAADPARATSWVHAASGAKQGQAGQAAEQSAGSAPSALGKGGASPAAMLRAEAPVPAGPETGKPLRTAPEGRAAGQVPGAAEPGGALAPHPALPDRLRWLGGTKPEASGPVGPDRALGGVRRTRPGDVGLDAPPATGSAFGVGGPAPPMTAEASSEAGRIGRQVAAQPVLRTGGSAEFTLAPEELGHLRLSVEVGESGLRVVIEAARPETADLMRRHVEALRQELRQEGLGAVEVSIGGGDGRHGRGAAPGRNHGEDWPAAMTPTVGGEPGAPSVPSLPSRSAGAAGRIDLRF